MPYLDKEDMKAIRQELKTQFPEIKFSVVKNQFSTSVDIAILSSPYDFSKCVAHLKEGIGNLPFEDSPNFVAASEVIFQNIIKVAKGGATKGEGSHKGHPFHEGTYYEDFNDKSYFIGLTVGSEKKEYEQIKSGSKQKQSQSRSHNAGKR